MRYLPTLAAVAAVAVVACSSAAPLAFPSGSNWTFPIVGTLEGGQLIVPVSIQGTGPYLMVIDPDSDRTVIDEAIVKQIDVQVGRAGDILDESDTIRHRAAAEVLSLTIGNLTVGRQYYYVIKSGGLQIAGRDIRGVIGRDIIADGLAFGYDRERGVGYLTTQGAFTPPAGATAVSYKLYDVIDQTAVQGWSGAGEAGAAPSAFKGVASCTSMPEACPQGEGPWSADAKGNLAGSETLAVGRRLVQAQIGGVTAKVHLDLGAAVSQLRRSLWPKAGLSEVAAVFDLRDEAGTSHHMVGGGVAETVTIGGVSARKTAFAPYDDKRWDPQFIDGTLALDALRSYNVWANWDKHAFYLVPRGDVLATAKERIGRWQSPVLDRCADGGCAHVKLLTPTAPAQAAPPDAAAPTPPDSAPPGDAAVKTRVVIMIDRDPSTAQNPLELVLAPVAKDGSLVPAPFIVVNLAADANQASTQLGPEYAGVDLRVVDASPYPRSCPSTGGCIDSIVP